jgi:hypothetical protein
MSHSAVDAEVEQAFRELRLKINHGRTVHVNHSDAWQRGKAAGEAVRFHAGVDGAGRTMIGGR